MLLRAISNVVVPIMDAQSEETTRALPALGLVAGQLLGDRYRVEARLGSGGMGEVWRAFDLKLGVEVALKHLLHGRTEDPARGELLRREVRSARNVASAYVCRVFDLVEIADREFVSMEYIDGWVLSEHLAQHAPLDLVEARCWAIQMLAGLQAIHEAGLVHRDLKPANLMITRTGRVVVMDFGLARSLAETQSLVVAGTPAYMAPEQVRGGPLSPATDIFAAGVILAEMVSPAASRGAPALRSLWEDLRAQPPRVPPGPWEAVIRRAVAMDPRARFDSAAEMVRALGEDRVLVANGERVQPYPGLASFTQADARFFFGREKEIESLWRKIQRLPMLALIGPSGVGKSSFLRAGVLATRPREWSCVICTPSNSPFVHLAEALAPEFPSDATAVRDLLHMEDPDVAVSVFHRWRKEHDAVLLILDQFEELFTLHPAPVQARFAQLLGRLVIEADVRVLVSMRDDFFFRCHEQAPLAPLCTEVTMLGSLEGVALRLALEQPALACGYRFENEDLVAAMLGEVEGERGALPMLAFAAAQLWDRRDSEQGLITREAYESIGGVSGALAQHAEQTLERIGLQRLPLVREIFRNLVTAQQTRLVREREELLSAFEDRQAAAEVLDVLIGARLLTSFEERGSDDESAHRRHRIEIVHESLLTAWPRLVRWQTQDADGAQLRDQLRQASQLWEQRSHSDDLLWTGTAFQEYSLWRDRYEGGLTESERAFGEAMQARVQKQKRRRRIAVVTGFSALLVVLGVVGGFWQIARDRARLAEALRFESIAETLVGEEYGDNTLALALSIAALERGDTWKRRQLALASLWKAPTHFSLPRADEFEPAGGVGFHPDGTWLATGSKGPQALLWPSDGGEPRVLPVPEAEFVTSATYSPSGRWLLAYYRKGSTNGYVLWDAATLARHSSREVGDWAPVWFHPDESKLLAYSLRNEVPYPGHAWWSIADATAIPLGSPRAEPPLQLMPPPPWYTFTFYPSADLRWLASWEGQDAYVSAIGDAVLEPRIWIGRHDAPIKSASLDAHGDLIGTADEQELRIWSRKRPGEPVLRAPASWAPATFTSSATRVFTCLPDPNLLIVAYDLRGPVGSRALPFLPSMYSPDLAHPVSGRDWVAIGSDVQRPRGVLLHPVRTIWPFHVALSSDLSQVVGDNFCLMAPSGQQVYSVNRGQILEIDLRSAGLPRRIVFEAPERRVIWTHQIDPAQQNLVVGTFLSGAWLVPLAEVEPIELEAAPSHTSAVAFSPSGALIAVGGGWKSDPQDRFVRVLDREGRVLSRCAATGDEIIIHVAFLSETELLLASSGALRQWNWETGEVRSLRDGAHQFTIVSENNFLSRDHEGIWIYDRATSRGRLLEGLERIGSTTVAIAPDESFVVVGDAAGHLRVWWLDDESLHDLTGPEGEILALWVDPRGYWIGAITSEGELSYWPVPRGRPLHDRPLGEFLDILRAQTNTRVVVDPRSPNGFRQITTEFPGWDSAPAWQEWYAEEYLTHPPWTPLLDPQGLADAHR